MEPLHVGVNVPRLDWAIAGASAFCAIGVLMIFTASDGRALFHGWLAVALEE